MIFFLLMIFFCSLIFDCEFYTMVILGLMIFVLVFCAVEDGYNVYSRDQLLIKDPDLEDYLHVMNHSMRELSS
ncbi:uncharacterized protein BDV14DRAFT_81643 [Aspergillus stella-maris]|uniref:uncharacterized protein n=1 Tax=Aspergillus stella-maris TaxID=1810926 RepID=UPI003CCD726C